MYSFNLAKTPTLPLLFQPRLFRAFTTNLHQTVPQNNHSRPRSRPHKPKPQAKNPVEKSSWVTAAEGYITKKSGADVIAEYLEDKKEREPERNKYIKSDGVKESRVRRSDMWDKEQREETRFPLRNLRSSWEASRRSAGAYVRENTRVGPVGNADVENEEGGEVEREMKSNYKSRDGFVEGEARFERPAGRDGYREARYERQGGRRWNEQESWGRRTNKEWGESTVPQMVGQGVYGVGPVLAALSVARREFHVLYVQEGMKLSSSIRKKKDKKGVEKVLKLAEKIGVKVVEASKHDLNMVVDNRPHQGLVLDASPLEMVSVKELDPPLLGRGKLPLWVALDEVTDPQNLGAIIRSAYFFGAEGVIMCAKNSAPLTGVVSKASAGSLELIELMSCKNMMQFLLSSVENGWRVLGGSVSSTAVPLSEVEARVPTILVLGSEGTGLRPLVERSCTQLIRIPGDLPIDGDVGGNEIEDGVAEVEQGLSGQDMKKFLAVESLNVSVAAGVLLYHLIGKNGDVVSEEPNGALE